MAVSATPDIRDRILDAATELFVRHGFHATSIRRICEAVGVNVAMVNYHFGSKDELYLRVLQRARDEERRWRATDPAEAQSLALQPAQRLAHEIAQLLNSVIHPGPGAVLTRLLSWELAEPTPALPTLVEQDIRLLHERYMTLLRAVAGSALDDEALRRCVYSVIGQVLFYAHSRSAHELVDPNLRYEAEDLARIARHIARFSLAGVAAIANDTGDAQ